MKKKAKKVPFLKLEEEILYVLITNTFFFIKFVIGVY